MICDSMDQYATARGLENAWGCQMGTHKEIFNFTDTYVIDVKDPENALNALMFVLAIDAEKCTRNKRQNF